MRSITVRDWSDWLFYLALAMLPVDGTVIGLYMPFWTPISPWLFLLYALVNWKSVAGIIRGASPSLRMFLMLPCAMVVLSVVGWSAVAMRPAQVLISVVALLASGACLLSVQTAVSEKRLPWRPMIEMVMAVYWLAFAVGVLQYLAVSWDVAFVREYFVHLMSREYVSDGRPQFLFAEPSYIGMHLFGVLLPLRWLLRHRAPDLAYNIGVLIVVFAVGAMALGAGTRIVLDSLVALVISIVISTTWRKRNQRRRGIAGLSGMLVIGAAAFALNNRLSSIIEHGVDGDGSFFGRVWQSLGVFCGLWKEPLNLLFGFGAGNLFDATETGGSEAVRILRFWGYDPSPAEHWYAIITPDSMFTMSAYASFVGEFGLVGFAVLIVAIVMHVAQTCGWNKTLVCWLLLVAYLYLQFEGYAFYALPLFMWGAPMLSSVTKSPDSETCEGRNT